METCRENIAVTSETKVVNTATILEAAGKLTQERGEVDATETTEAPHPFPTGSLPVKLQELVKEVASFTQTPDAMAASIAIGMVSAAIGGGVVLRLCDGSILPGNLFIMAVAPSGVGKGRTYSVIAAPLKSCEERLQKDWREIHLPKIMAELEVAAERAKRLGRAAAKQDCPTTRKELTEQFREAEAERQRLEAELARDPQITVGDITSEKLAMKMASQPHEAIANQSPEARGIISVLCGRYSKSGSSDEAVYLSGYSGDGIVVDRVGRAGVRLSTPRLSVLWLVQPDVVSQMLEDDRMVASGLLPRFLTANIDVDPQDEPLESPVLDGHVTREWHTLVEALVRHFRQHTSNPSEVTVSAEANDLRRDFANLSKARYRKAGDLYDVAAYPARWAENACRLALCLHLAEYGRTAPSIELSRDTMHKAIEIVRWFSEQQLSLLADSRSQKQRQRLATLRAILLEKGGHETERVLTKHHGFSKGELADLLERYPNQISQETIKPGPLGGRPSTVIILANFGNTPSTIGR